MAWKGSPDSQGVFYTGSDYPADEQILAANRLHAVEVKQAALQSLFATDGQWLEFVSPDGSTPMKCQMKGARIEFTPGIWFETSPYTVTVQTDVIYVNGAIYQGLSFPELIQSASENWNLQEGDVVKTFRVAHEVSAVGKKTFDNVGTVTKNPWEIAKDFVQERLTIGWLGTSTFSNTNGPYIFNHSSLASGSINLLSLSPYNFSRSEQVDEQAGSYSVSEAWTLAAAAGTDIYNVNVTRISPNPYESVHVGIQGTIKGFYTNLFDYDTRNSNAQSIWNSLQGTALFNRVSSYVPGVTLNTAPLVGALDYNTNEGIITYNFEYSNTLYNGDAFEQYVVSRKSTAEDYKSSYIIQGSIKGRRYDGDLDTTASLQRANVLWNSITPTTLYNRIVSSKYFPEASGIGLRIGPINKEVSINEAEGTINYSYEFNNRKNDNDYQDNNVVEEYALSRHFSREEGRITYTINGTVRGLSIDDSSDPKTDKYAAASGYFYGFAQPNLYNRVSNYFNVALANQNSQVEEIELNPSLGQIGYNFQFSNIPNTLLPGVLSEVITVTEQNAKGNVNVFANIGIPGRSQGPILQNISTSIAKVRSVNIEVVLPPTGTSNIFDSWNAKPDYDSFIAPLQPANSFTEDDSDTYSWREGRYTKSVRWIYI